MKKIAFNLIVSLTLIILILSCDNTQKDWERIHYSNSITEYQLFIKNHPKSDLINTAQILIDSIEWCNVLKIHNLDSLNRFYNTHNSSAFLTRRKDAIDSLEWSIAFYSRDSTKLNDYIKKYTNSVNIQKALDIIWEIKWPPVSVEKARGLVICDKNGFKNFLGGSGTKRIIIWREFFQGDIEWAKKIGLLIGIAYLQTDDGNFKFVRKVDLKKTDKELCKEFGINN